MKLKPVAGLITAGGIAQSLVPRLPLLLASLGPVVASSLRVARRIANSLRAGYAASSLAALDPCPLIWIAVRDAALDPLIRRLVSETALSGKMIVFCDSLRDSASATLLRGAGARVASLNAIDSDARTLVAEGHSTILAELRRLAAREKRKLIEIRPSSKALYLAGSQLAGDLLLPWIAAAVESLRAAGFSRADATSVVETVGTRALHSYVKAGSKAWSRAAAQDMRRVMAGDLGPLRSANPRLASLYAAGAAHALDYFEREK